MPLHLKSSIVDEANQKLNDRHQITTVLAVLGILLLYLYTFTNVSTLLSISPPQTAASSIGIKLDYIWTDFHNVASHLYVPNSKQYGEYDEQLILFILVGCAFLSAYFLPLKFKKASIVFWFLMGFKMFYGFPAALLFLGMHLLIYSLFITEWDYCWVIFMLLGSILGFYLFKLFGYSYKTALLGSGTGGAVFYFVYFFGYQQLTSQKKILRILQTIAIQSPIIIAWSGALSEGMTGFEWKLPMGILLFFWQWTRLMVFHQDYMDGQVPSNISPADYLHVFLTPGLLANWTYAPYVGQGYSYLTSRFLCDDKNKIVLAGIKLLLLAFLYFVFSDWIVIQIISLFEIRFGIIIYPYTNHLVNAFHDKIPVTTATVLLTTMLDQIRVFLVFGGITHFRVAIWRILGYQVDPQYNSFWLATNLVSLWQRFAFHFREFLVRCFYYPTFFRFFKNNLILRVFTATMVASAFGNYIWGHVPDRLYDKGITYDYLVSILERWPYFLLLGTGISLTQLYLMRKGRTRKAWTWDRRFILDIFCAYLTFQYFSLIHIFARPHPSGNLMESTILFLKGFGIHLS